VRLLDRYVFKLYGVSFFAALLAFSSGLVALDFFARMQQFLDTERLDAVKAEGGWFVVVLKFYAAYLPYLLKELMPFVTTSAALVTILILQRANEVQPVLAAGVSARRLFAPILLSAFAVSLGLLGFQEFVVPTLNPKIVRIKRLFSGNRDLEIKDVPHLRDGKGTVVRAARYRLFNPTGLKRVVIMRPWEEEGFESWLIEFLEPDGDGWRATNGGQIMPADQTKPVRQLAKGARVEFGVTPQEVEVLISRQGTAESSFRQLKALADKFPDRRSLQVALHRQVAQPLSCFALVLLAIPLLLRAGGSVARGGGRVFLASGALFVMTVFCNILGDRGDLSPLLAAYLPVTFFLCLGLARFVEMRT